MRWLATVCRNTLQFALTALIRAYQLLLSPLLGPRCRFHPSCSQYALEALERHGPFKGGWLAVHRICRCHPLNAGGHDPVPDRWKSASNRTTRESR